MPLPNPNLSNSILIPGNTQVLQYKDARELPPGAVVLNRSQIVVEMMKAINSWTPRTEMWPLTYGLGLLGGLSMTSGMIINTMYRQRLRLLAHGRISSYLPILILPATCSMLLHQMRVTESVLLKEDTCPVCYEIRSATLQTLTGWVMPFSLSVLSSLALARTKHTIHVPNMRDVSAISKFLKKTLNPLGLTLTLLLAMNILTPVWITQKEMKLVPKVWERVGLQTTDHPHDRTDS